MDKKEFIRQLHQMLSDLPEEERREAVSYYEEYLEDAGPEQEAQTLAELGSPEQVAATIRENLYTDPVQNGVYTETGYHDRAEQGGKLELDHFTQIVPQQTIGNVEDTEDDTEKTSEDNRNYQTKSTAGRQEGGYFSQENTGSSRDRGDTNQEADRIKAAGNRAGGKQASWQKKKEGMSKETKALLIVLALLFSIPLAAIALSVIAVIVGVMITVFGVTISFIAITGACLLTGVVLVVVGIANIFSASPAGILLCGLGFLFFGAGMLFLIATVFVCKTLLPILAKGFVSLCRLPFQKGENMA